MHIYEYVQRRKEIKHKRRNASEKRKTWQDRRKEKKDAGNDEERHCMKTKKGEIRKER